MTVGMHLIFCLVDVKGDATDASATDNDTPAWAVFRAPQSFAPSPHIPTWWLPQKQNQYLFKMFEKT